jgi:YaiO family outer membrane protein
MANAAWFACLCLAVFRPLSADVDAAQIESYIAEGRHEELEIQLRQQIEAEPGNFDAHFQLARLLSWQHKYSLAESEYQLLLASEPGNADYLFGLAQVGVWQGKPRSVLTQIEAAERLQPDNPEIWRLHIQALADLDDVLSHWQAVLTQQRAAEFFPHLAWKQVETLESAEVDGFLETNIGRTNKLLRNKQTELGASYNLLSRGKGYWRSEFLSVERQFAAHESVYANYLQMERFLLNDEQFLLGAYYPQTPNLILNLEGDFSPYALVLARDSLMSSFQWIFYPSWSFTGGYRHSDYVTGPLQQTFATLEHYFADFRAAYTFRATEAFYAIQYGQRFDFSYFYQDSSFLTMTFSTGAEIGGFQGTVYNTQYFGLRGRHWLDQNWAISWDLAFSQQGNAYSRGGVGLGIRRVF